MKYCRGSPGWWRVVAVGSFRCDGDRLSSVPDASGKRSALFCNALSRWHELDKKRIDIILIYNSLYGSSTAQTSETFCATNVGLRLTV